MKQPPANGPHPVMGNDELVLRPACLDDAPFLSERCYPDYSPTEMAQVLAASIQGKGTDRHLWLVAEQEDQIVGAGQLTSWRRGCEIANVVVVRPFRRRGIGRALVVALLAHAQETNCSEIEIGVESDNTAALALYRQLGFRQYHTLDLTMDDRPVTLVYLSHRL